MKEELEETKEDLQQTKPSIISLHLCFKYSNQELMIKQCRLGQKKNYMSRTYRIVTEGIQALTSPA
jgi:hypothetical protein